MAKKKHSKKLPKTLPVNFVARLESIYGRSLKEEILKTFVDKPTTFRINTLRAERSKILEILRENHFLVEKVGWYEDAFILKNKTKRELTDLGMYKDGLIYIQSLASMVPPLILDPVPGEKILDLTAAPGSKTSQMAALMEKRGELVANDLNKIRFFRLKANMEVLGVSDPFDGWDFHLRMEDASVLTTEYAEYFDKVLLDVPCSGEARFIEGYPKSYGYWSEKKIKALGYRQQKILFSGWSALKKGGSLVYSTCTMAPEENEVRISKFLDRVGEDAKLEKISIKGLKMVKPIMEWKGKKLHKEVSKTLRILPTKQVEGFFVAKITKL